jgi:hypothetical protein
MTAYQADPFVLNDFIMLGRTEPVPSTKHGLSICAAGYSPTHRKLFRIYPLPFPNYVKAGTVCRIPLVRPKGDNRVESWRIKADGETAQDALAAITEHDHVELSKYFDVFKSMAMPSIHQANNAKPDKLSLAFIEPKGIAWEFARRDNVDPAEQMTLWDRVDPGGELHKSDLLPYLTFEDEDGRHRLQIKEWGCVQWLVKQRENANQLWDNLRLTDPNYKHLLLVGNQNNQRTSWLIIKTFYVRKTNQQSLGLWDEEQAA